MPQTFYIKPLALSSMRNKKQLETVRTDYQLKNPDNLKRVTFHQRHKSVVP